MPHLHNIGVPVQREYVGLTPHGVCQVDAGDVTTTTGKLLSILTRTSRLRNIKHIGPTAHFRSIRRIRIRMFERI